MPTWGSSFWLLAPPTYPPPAYPVYDPLGSYAPFFMALSPQNGAVNVLETTAIRVGFFDPDTVWATNRVDPSTFRVYVNDVLVYDGSTSKFSAGWAGKYTDNYCYRYFLDFAPLKPFAHGSTVRVRATVTDFATPSNTANAEFSFTVRQDPDCYQGTQLLPEESWLLSPLTQFLDLEPLRLLLLQQVLNDDTFRIENRNAVAARALYQLAYDTEISALLNPYMQPDETALASTVCQKRSTLELSLMLEGYKNSIAAGLDSLITHGALPREYRANLADYQESLLYTYRVAVAVVAVFLARAVEVAAEAPAAVNTAAPALLPASLPVQL